MSAISSGTTSTTTLIHSGDTTGSLVFKTNDTGSGGTTALTLDTSQNATFAGKVTSAGALTLASNGSTTAMTIDTSQRVGIGTSNPAATLDVTHSNGGSVAVRGVSTDGARMRFYNNAGTTSQFQIGQGFSTGTDNVGYVYNIANAALVFGTNNTEQMRIDSSGNVGIGVNPPSTRLDVRQNTASDLQLQLYNNNAGAYASAIKLNSDNTTGSRYNTIQSYNSATAQWQISGGGSDSTIAFGTGSSLTERMRIDSSGNLKLSTAGTKILNSSGNPILQQTGSVLQVLQTVKTDTFSTTSGSFTDVTGLTVSITPTSSTSKILVMLSIAGVGATTTGSTARIARNGTGIGVATSTGSRSAGGTAEFFNSRVDSFYTYSSIVLDSPATTSSITYSGQVIAGSGGGAYTIYVNRTINDTDSSGWTRGASSITVMEIAA